MSGKAWKFGDSISTDLIAPGRYYHLRSRIHELAKHVLEDARPEFPAKVKQGDFVVGGENFGLGSSREHAAIIIKLSGASAVIAKSVARIFFRNCINVGLPVITCDTSNIDDGDELEVDLAQGKLYDRTKNFELDFPPLPEIMTKILNEGGIVEFIKKHGDLKAD
ncbi:MAG: 3-isopropylmalate dehydratase small subunit [Thermoplasmata archaeon]|nr:3-isopropylmalate dehydratase small subunit [Thermoplasmata archaeon]